MLLIIEAPPLKLQYPISVVETVNEQGNLANRMPLNTNQMKYIYVSVSVIFSILILLHTK